MLTRNNVLIGLVLLALSMTGCIVISGNITELSRLQTAPTSTPAACLSQAHDCVTATFLGYTQHDDGTTTLTHCITNNCMGWVTPTPVLDQAVHLTMPYTLPISQEINGQTLTNINIADVDERLLVATGWMEDYGRLILTIDLTTGDVQPIGHYRSSRLIYDLAISDNNVVWVEETQENNQAVTTLHLVDLTTEIEQMFTGSIYRHVTLKDNLILWDGIVDGVSGIYGYDITQSHLFTVEVSTPNHIVGFPRICSGSSFIYLSSTTNALPHLAELWHHNPVSTIKKLIGKIGMTNHIDTMYQHECDGVNIVWLGASYNALDGTTSKYGSLLLLNQTTNTENILDTNLTSPARLSFQGSIVIRQGFRNVGYDIQRKVSFDANLDALPNRGTGVPVFLGQNMLIWIPTNDTGQVNNLIIAPIRSN